MATVAPSSSAPARVDAPALTARLVSLIEHDHLSVAQAARSVGVALETASTLVRMHAIELEAAESELDERLEDLERQCPGEDWWSYSDRQQTAIIQGSAIPNRIMRELVDAWQQRTRRGTGALRRHGRDQRRGAAPLTRDGRRPRTDQVRAPVPVADAEDDHDRGGRAGRAGARDPALRGVRAMTAGRAYLGGKP